jgi:hypothetical protein
MKQRLKHLRKAHLRNLLTLGVNGIQLLQHLANLQTRFTPFLQQLKPKHLVLPVAFAQLIVLVIAAQHPLDEAIIYGTIGNLAIVACAIFPVTLKDRGI